MRLTPLRCVCHAPDAHDTDETAHDRPTEGFKAIEDDDRRSTARDMPRHAARGREVANTRKPAPSADPRPHSLGDAFGPDYSARSGGKIQAHSPHCKCATQADLQKK